MARLRPPPFANEVGELQKRGEILNLFIYCGANAWERARRSRAPGYRLCLPPGNHFTEFDWRIVRGEAITLIYWGADPQFAIEFSRHLVRSGASLVAMLAKGDTAFFKPAPANTRAAA